MTFPILATGTASEYCVGPIAQALRSQDWNVTELDFGVFTNDTWSVLDTFPVGGSGYITSAHTHASKRFYDVAVPSIAAAYPNLVAPVEILTALQPKCSMYVPHDLLTPLGEGLIGEARFLGLYDYVLAPYGGAHLQAALGPDTRVIEVGWAKYQSSGAPARVLPPTSGDLPRVAVFITNFGYMLERHGIDGVCEYLRPLLGPNVHVKLPSWYGAEEVSARLRRDSDATIVSPDVSSTELILGADLVICNAASSIHAEATLLGRPCIALVDNELYTEAEQRKALGHLPNISFEQYRPGEVHITEDRIRELATGPFEPTLKPFDTELVLELLHAAE